LQLGQAALEEAPLGVGVNVLQRALVLRAGFLVATEPAQQFGPRGV
jgi:hypothetical protein